VKVLVNLLRLVLFSLLIPLGLKGQNDYPLDINYFEFINYDKNKFDFPGDSLEFERFFSKMDTLMLRGTGKISIVHIGGSHIQADVYSGRTRERLQNFYPGMNGGRGSVFPYRISKSNNPNSYSTKSTGNWSSCRNVDLIKSCNLGLTGISAFTNDTLAQIDFYLKHNTLTDYYFDRVRIFHSMDSLSFLPILEMVKVVRTEVDRELGFTLFYLDRDYNSFQLKLNKSNQNQLSFELYGISLENDDPGFVYHSIGINGASFPSFLRCNLLEKHLTALKPDLVIISLGTNDAYTTKFDPGFYKSNYEEMIRRIRNAAPSVAILNTVANDSYLFKRYPNKNTQLASDVIYDVAKEYNCGVWDFYEVMGGFNSSLLWRKQNLMIKDMIHFNKEGYILIGDLLFNAFIQSYNNHMNSLIRN